MMCGFLRFLGLVLFVPGTVLAYVGGGVVVEKSEATFTMLKHAKNHDQVIFFDSASNRCLLKISEYERGLSYHLTGVKEFTKEISAPHCLETRIAEEMTAHFGGCQQSSAELLDETRYYASEFLAFFGISVQSKQDAAVTIKKNKRVTLDAHCDCLLTTSERTLYTTGQISERRQSTSTPATLDACLKFFPEEQREPVTRIVGAITGQVLRR